MKKNLRLILGLLILGGIGGMHGAALPPAEQEFDSDYDSDVDFAPDYGGLSLLRLDLNRQAAVGNLAAVKALAEQAATEYIYDTPVMLSAALNAALVNQHEDVAQFLIAHGADLSRSLSIAFTSRDRNLELIRQLLKREAKLDETSLLIVPQEYLSDLSTAQLLMDEFHVKFEQVAITEALRWAQVRNDFDLVKYLVSKGADITTRLDDGATVLMFAVNRGDENFVRSLLDVMKKRVLTSLLAGKELVPEHEKIEEGQSVPPDVAFMVLKPIVWADFINAKNNHGHTALWYARHGSHPNPNIEKMLFDAGAIDE